MAFNPRFDISTSSTSDRIANKDTDPMSWTIITLTAALLFIISLSLRTIRSPCFSALHNFFHSSSTTPSHSKTFPTAFDKHGSAESRACDGCRMTFPSLQRCQKCAEQFKNDAFARGWRYKGGSATASPLAITAAVDAMSREDANCFMLASLLLSRSHPSPASSLWIVFGFCVCTSYTDEVRLARTYADLLQRSTFSEITAAYKISGMTALFDRRGVPIDLPHFREVMDGPPNRPFLTVWYLKAFVMHDEDHAARPIRSVERDYGFANCRTEKQWDILRDIYRRFFESFGDPLQLHAACLQGSTGALYSIVTARVRPMNKKRAKALKEVMRNGYPITVLPVLVYNPVTYTMSLLVFYRRRLIYRR